MEKELRVLVWITLFMVSLALSLNWRKQYAEWACAQLCEARGQYGTVEIELLRANCMCSGRLK